MIKINNNDNNNSKNSQYVQSTCAFRGSTHMNYIIQYLFRS